MSVSPPPAPLSVVYTIDMRLAILAFSGTSDGFEPELAIQQASASLNIFLASRNQAKLEAVVADIGFIAPVTVLPNIGLHVCVVFVVHATK